MEIVTLKQDIFAKRFRAEYGAHRNPAPESEEAINHSIEQIREDLFNVSFE